MARQTRYPSEFKEEAVALVNSSGRSIADVARSLGVSDRTLWYWVSEDRKARERAEDPTALTAVEPAELKRLRKVNAQQLGTWRSCESPPHFSRKRPCGDRLPLRPRPPSRVRRQRSVSGHRPAPLDLSRGWVTSPVNERGTTTISSARSGRFTSFRATPTARRGSSAT